MSEGKSRLLIVASRGTADGLYPALILATTAVSQGKEAYIYFTFGGMKLLTKQMAETIKPSVDLGLSKEELEQLLAKGGMPSLVDMLKMAKESGVKIYACSPTMNLFGLKQDDLVDVVDEVIGASAFLQMASDPKTLAIFI
ncbi:MAG TPA: peroxiredoxin [Candidatus Caldiarchaeum subterraneum]|uniref:Peroxiredoxin n=1 Tax=Caldiarchaeum subterraneum TaxID=311458 RepID=A0A832ZXP1_CALS0|nr:peroxiredoxin [Candidatus Caldarchaeum subterraneum]